MSAVSDRNIAIKRILDSLYARAIDKNLTIDESEYKNPWICYFQQQLGDLGKFS